MENNKTIIKLHNKETGDKREIKLNLNPISLELHYDAISLLIVELTMMWSARGYEVLIGEGGEA